MEKKRIENNWRGKGRKWKLSRKGREPKSKDKNTKVQK